MKDATLLALHEQIVGYRERQLETAHEAGRNAGLAPDKVDLFLKLFHADQVEAAAMLVATECTPSDGLEFLTTMQRFASSEIAAATRLH